MRNTLLIPIFIRFEIAQPIGSVQLARPDDNT